MHPTPPEAITGTELASAISRRAWRFGPSKVPSVLMSVLMMAAMMLPSMAPIVAIYAGLSAKEDNGLRLALRIAIFASQTRSHLKLAPTKLF